MTTAFVLYMSLYDGGGEYGGGGECGGVCISEGGLCTTEGRLCTSG